MNFGAFSKQTNIDNVSKFQSFRASKLQSFKVSKFQSFKVSKFQSFKFSKFHRRHGGGDCPQGNWIFHPYLPGVV